MEARGGRRSFRRRRNHTSIMARRGVPPAWRRPFSTSARRWPDTRHRERQACGRAAVPRGYRRDRSEEHTSELQSLMRISYAVFCLKKKKKNIKTKNTIYNKQKILKRNRVMRHTLQ